MSRLVIGVLGATLAAWLFGLVLVWVAFFGVLAWLYEDDSPHRDWRCLRDEVEIPSWAHVAPEQIAEAKKHGVPVAFENDLGMRFVLIPAGTFLMGSPEEEEGRESREGPQHEVTLTRPFYMQVTEVTNAQYRRLEPGHDSGKARLRPDHDGASLNDDGQPVVAVSWEAAQAFLERLGQQDADRTYRLPTEAEWEHACRAGTTARYWSGNTIEDLARVDWYRGNSDERSRPVGEKPASPWGLYDMHGNAWEWCQDALGRYAEAARQDPLFERRANHGSRVLRGGAWSESAEAARSANRNMGRPANGGMQIGFRLVSPLPEKGE